MKIEGGCHCGAVRFRVDIAPPVQLLDCNCSNCSKTGYLHLIVPEERFELLSGKTKLTTYRFGTRAAQHLFCEVCGVKSFYRPRSHPEGWSVNYCCLDEGHEIEAEIVPYDGRNWERARAGLE